MLALSLLIKTFVLWAFIGLASTVWVRWNLVPRMRRLLLNENLPSEIRTNLRQSLDIILRMVEVKPLTLLVRCTFAGLLYLAPVYIGLRLRSVEKSFA